MESLQRIRCLIRECRFEEVETELRLALEGSKDEAGIYKTVCSLYFEGEKFNLPFEIIKSAVESDPEFLREILSVCNALYKEQMLEESLYLLEALRDAAPGDPEVWNDSGAVLLSLGLIEEARICLENAVRLNPYYAEAYVNLGELSKMIGHDEEANEWLRKYIDLRKEYDMEGKGRLALLQGWLSFIQGERNTAVKHFEYAEEITKTNPQVFLDITLASHLLKDEIKINQIDSEYDIRHSE